MTRFALPYDPDAAPVQWIVGRGFSPAWQPADFVGPRLDCPMWVPAPDADAPMIAKVPPLDPWDHMPAAGYAWGTWTPAADTAAPQVTAASLAGPIPGHIWQPLTPIWPDPWSPSPDYPCHCVEAPPINPGPQPAPVPVEAGAGAFLIVAIGALAAWKAWTAMGAFGDWFTAERGTGPHQNGWV